LRAQSERAAGDAYNLGFVLAKDLRAPPATAALMGTLLYPQLALAVTIGIVFKFNLSGSFAAATDELNKKGLKAYFAL
jgi:hypothetical protein